MSSERKTFYDQHPFDWVSPDASDEIRSVISSSLVELIQKLPPASLVLDVGCGPGRVLGFLSKRDTRCVGVDCSQVSLRLAIERHHAPGVVADNLRLPFAEGIADVVISDGVIHHTDDPRAAFAENCRVLKPGGEMYLAVYKPFGRYPWLYKYPGAIIRRSLRYAWAKPLVTIFAQMPYFLIHSLRSRGKRTWAGARNLFFDYFVTPRVVFLSHEIIGQWCKEQRIRVSKYAENRGSNVHSFRLVKDLNGKFTSITGERLVATIRHPVEHHDRRIR